MLENYNGPFNWLVGGGLLWKVVTTPWTYAASAYNGQKVAVVTDSSANTYLRGLTHEKFFEGVEYSFLAFFYKSSGQTYDSSITLQFVRQDGSVLASRVLDHSDVPADTWVALRLRYTATAADYSSGSKVGFQLFFSGTGPSMAFDKLSICREFYDATTVSSTSTSTSTSDWVFTRCSDGPDPSFERTVVASGTTVTYALANSWIYPTGQDVRVIGTPNNVLAAAANGTKALGVFNVEMANNIFYYDMPYRYNAETTYSFSMAFRKMAYLRYGAAWTATIAFLKTDGTVLNSYTILNSQISTTAWRTFTTYVTAGYALESSRSFVRVAVFFTGTGQSFAFDIPRICHTERESSSTST